MTTRRGIHNLLSFRRIHRQRLRRRRGDIINTHRRLLSNKTSLSLLLSTTASNVEPDSKDDRENDDAYGCEDPAVVGGCVDGSTLFVYYSGIGWIVLMKCRIFLVGNKSPAVV